MYHVYISSQRKLDMYHNTQCNRRLWKPSVAELQFYSCV